MEREEWLSWSSREIESVSSSRDRVIMQLTSTIKDVYLLFLILCLIYLMYIFAYT